MVLRAYMSGAKQGLTVSGNMVGNTTRGKVLAETR